MRILVTGAAGFLGSNASLRYLKAGHEVVGVDNFCSSARDSQHLQHLKTFDTFEFLEQDIVSENFVLDHVGRPHYDLVLNFACPASPPVYQKIPVYTMMTCVVGTMNVFDVADSHRTTVVHMSTSEVYGDPTVSPQPESYKGNVNSYGPRSCYDSGKRAAEALAYDYRNKSLPVDVKVVRIFNTYGPNMSPDDGRVISNFVTQALKNEPLTVYGDGSQTRSCCYVDDLLRGIEQVAASDKSFSGPVNLGNPEEYTVLELAQQVLEKLPESTSKIVFKDLPVDDPMKRKPDITMAMRELGWMPKVCLDRGLDLTIEHFRGLLVR
jgi:UDP-glucuronate decarboxylase